MANSAKITSYSGTATEITIPTTIEGKIVKEIASNAFADKGITKITVDAYAGEIPGAPWGATGVTPIYLKPAVSDESYMVLTRSRALTNTDPSWTRTCYVKGKEVAFDVRNYKFLNPTEATLSSGDVMVKIPKFYYARTVANDTERIVLSDTTLASETVSLHPAFSRYNLSTQATVEVPYIYVAKSLCVRKQKSTRLYATGKAFATTDIIAKDTSTYSVTSAITASENTSWSAIESKVSLISEVPMSNGQATYPEYGFVKKLSEWRTAARAKGNGWEQFDIKDVSVFQFLHLGKYASYAVDKGSMLAGEKGEANPYETGVAISSGEVIDYGNVRYVANTAITASENTGWSAVSSKVSEYVQSIEEFGIKAFLGKMINIEGMAMNGGYIKMPTSEADYNDSSKWVNSSVQVSTTNTNTITTYDANYPWIMFPGGGTGGSSSAGLCSKNLINNSGTQICTFGGYDPGEAGIVSFCSNDGVLEMTGYYKPHQYYTSRLVFYPVDGNTQETYKSMLGASIIGNDATGFRTHTGITTTTYKYVLPTVKEYAVSTAYSVGVILLYNSANYKVTTAITAAENTAWSAILSKVESVNAIVKEETISEVNTLRYWLHIPFDYNPAKKYNLITYLDGSGGVELIQSNENGCSGYNRLNLSYFSDTSSVNEIKNSYHLQLLSAEGASSAGHTGYIDSAYKFNATNIKGGTMEKNHIGVTDGDSIFLKNWLTYVKANPEYDAFIIVPQWTDELFFENRSQYTKLNTTCKQMDIHNAYLYGYGEKISSKTYGHTYLVNQLSASPCQQLVNQVQDQLMEKYSIDPKKLTVMGFSLGGVGTYDFIAHNPGRYATAIPHSAAGCDLSTETLTKLVGTKIMNCSGTSDGWVGGAEFGDALVTRFTALGGSAQSVKLSGGHRPVCFENSTTFNNIIDFIYNNARD